MAGRDPLVLARQMAEAWLARPDVVAKGAGAVPSLGVVTMAFLPQAEGLARTLDALDCGFDGITRELDGVTAKMQLVLEQDQHRKAESAALEERIRNPRRQVRFGDLDGARLAALREMLRTAGVPQVPVVDGHGAEAAGG